jgi:hypothetical protein
MGQVTCAHQRLENQKFGIASSEIPQGKVSESTDHRVSGIRGCSARLLDSRSREFRSSKNLRKGDRAMKRIYG